MGTKVYKLTVYVPDWNNDFDGDPEAVQNAIENSEADFAYAAAVEVVDIGEIDEIDYHPLNCGRKSPWNNYFKKTD